MQSASTPADCATVSACIRKTKKGAFQYARVRCRLGRARPWTVQAGATSSYIARSPLPSAMRVRRRWPQCAFTLVAFGRPASVFWQRQAGVRASGESPSKRVSERPAQEVYLVQAVLERSSDGAELQVSRAPVHPLATAANTRVVPVAPVL